MDGVLQQGSEVTQAIPMSNVICFDCKGTGLIETETLDLGVPSISSSGQPIFNNTKGRGDWKMTVCPCKSDDDEQC